MNARNRLPLLDRLPLHTDPIPLQDDFPVFCSELHHHNDRQIAFLQQHRILEIGYCHSGRGTFIVGPRIIRFRPGDVIFIPAEEKHIARSNPGTESVWHWLHCDPIRLTGPLLDDFAVGDFSSDTWRWSCFHYPRSTFPRINQLVCSIIAEFESKEDHWRNVVRSQFYTLFVLLHRRRRQTSRDGGAVESGYPTKAALWPRIRPALEHMAEHYGDQITVNDMAQRCNMSATNFRRVFALSTGKTPHDYLSNLRISAAAMELRSSARKVNDIAMSCGFPTLTAFNRAFKHAMKVTPKEWRR